MKNNSSELRKHILQFFKEKVMVCMIVIKQDFLYTIKIA